MIYALLQKGGPLVHVALFGYITFRAMLAFLTAFFVAFLWGPSVISALRQHQKKGQPIRDDGPQHHKELKKGTPTMGGLLILGSFAAAVLLWGNLANPVLWWLLFVTFAFGIVGLIDDSLKLYRHNHHGLRPLQKTLLQLLFAGLSAAALWFLLPEMLRDTLHFPFLKHAFFHLSWLWPLFALVVLIGSSNAVNLTDGLDGLAVGPVVIATAVLSIIAYVVGHKAFALYLQLPYVPGAGEMGVLGAALIGACLGFLWYNAPPAMVFMGDTGSMAMGGFLGGAALLVKHELVFALVGGIFVLEALSVMIQVGYFKATRKRIFLMAPLHHHFEHKGWSESAIVFRFWIISLILGIFGLASLKIR
ncbi:MAG: phospho-N-acetylmuramoyl-pentapeptide-transferase [Holosporaceae bacterium]